jgi:hypothetical protein
MTRGRIAEGGSPQGCSSCSTPDAGREEPMAEAMGRSVATASSVERPPTRVGMDPDIYTDVKFLVFFLRL